MIIRGDEVAGREELFERTYAQFGAKLYYLCLVELKNRQDAEDAVQDVFIKRLYRAPEFKSDAHEKNWMYKAAVHTCRDMLRKKSRKELSLEAAGEVGFLPEQSALLSDVMNLPQKYRVVLHLHYYEGYAVKEIAGVLGVTVSAVKMRLKRGRDMLRVELEDE